MPRRSAEQGGSLGQTVALGMPASAATPVGADASGAPDAPSAPDRPVSQQDNASPDTRDLTASDAFAAMDSLPGDPAPPTVDARGMRCPWPVLRAARAMRTGLPFILLSDDPIARKDVPDMALARGWRCTVSQGDDGSEFLLHP